MKPQSISIYSNWPSTGKHWNGKTSLHINRIYLILSTYNMFCWNYNFNHSNVKGKENAFDVFYLAAKNEKKSKFLHGLDTKACWTWMWLLQPHLSLTDASSPLASFLAMEHSKNHFLHPSHIDVSPVLGILSTASPWVFSSKLLTRAQEPWPSSWMWWRIGLLSSFSLLPYCARQACSHLFLWVTPRSWGSKLRSSCLCGKHFADRPVPNSLISYLERSRDVPPTLLNTGQEDPLLKPA